MYCTKDTDVRNPKPAPELTEHLNFKVKKKRNIKTIYFPQSKWRNYCFSNNMCNSIRKNVFCLKSWSMGHRKTVPKIVKFPLSNAIRMLFEIMCHFWNAKKIGIYKSASLTLYKTEVGYWLCIDTLLIFIFGALKGREKKENEGRKEGRTDRRKREREEGTHYLMD